MAHSKALIISNPFKGTLSSLRIGEIVKEELSKKDIEADYFAATDGGDGFLDSFKCIYEDTFLFSITGTSNPK